MPSLSDEIYPGTSILLPKRGGDIRHLWIVLTEPEGHPPQVAIVNLTTRRAGSDDTCVLQPGDHEFVKAESVIHYADATIAPAEPLRRIAKLADYDFHADCSDELLKRIRHGLLSSPFTHKKIKIYCQARFTPQEGANAAAELPPRQ
jgi:hypothetical protein